MGASGDVFPDSTSSVNSSLTIGALFLPNVAVFIPQLARARRSAKYQRILGA